MIDRLFEAHYGGLHSLFGGNGIKRLQESHVLIIGVGGVGSWCAEALARSGVGIITLMDFDDVCASNINRQVHALKSTIGQSKITVMKSRIEDITNSCQVNLIHDFFTKNSLAVLEDRYDYIIDCIDSVAHKSLLAYECRRKSQPLITVGATAGKRDPRLVEIKDLHFSRNDFLLRQVRRTLKRNYKLPRERRRKWHIPCVYSRELIEKDSLNLDGSCLPTDLKQSICENGLGTSSYMVGTFAFFACYYVIEQLLDKDLINDVR